MSVKDSLLYHAKSLYSRLPMSLDQRTRFRNQLFGLAGPLFQDLQSYKDWKMERMLDAEADVDFNALKNTRETIFADHFATDPNSNAFLFITHSLGGGTEHHVQSLGASLQKEGVRIYVLRSAGKSRVKLCHLKEESGKRLFFDLNRAGELAALESFLRKLGITLLHIHHKVDFFAGFGDVVLKLAQDLGVAYDFTVHDYFAICPRFTLYDDAVRGYCGEPAVSKCNACVKTYGSAAGKQVDVGAWRDRYRVFLHGARRVYVPNVDVSDRLSRYFPEVEFQVMPHAEEPRVSVVRPAARKENDPLQVLSIGAIAPHKGSHVLEACALDALKRKLPIHFTILGYTDIDWKLRRLSNVTVTGKYTRDEQHDHLTSGTYHLAFLPAVWPETYNYTLSEALRYGIYPVGLDIGAISERIKRLGWGAVLDYSLYQYPERINDALLAITLTPAPKRAIEEHFVQYGNYLEDYYRLGLTG